jgi:DNA-binding MarR family transcriptional regulator
LTSRIDEPFDLDRHFPFRIAVVTNLLQLNKDASIRRLSPLEPREFRVLINIGSYMPIKSADIAYLGRLDSYTVSRAVKSLLKEKLVEIEEHPTNKKVKNLVLTESGIELYREVVKQVDERTRELESVLTEPEKEELLRLLALLESKSESMIANHAITERDSGQPIPADQKEIIRWHRKSSRNQMYSNLK